MGEDHQRITVKDETFVLVPVEEYEFLSRCAEAAEDAAEEAWATKLYDEHVAAKARGEHIAMPRDQWARIRQGESPVKVVREYRGLTQTALAETSGVAQPEISAIEGRTRSGSTTALKALAKALQVPLDVLVADG
ncbi:MAG: helix-turn-helix transcriptional regulator [Asticcacaulis sp.]